MSTLDLPAQPATIGDWVQVYAIARFEYQTDPNFPHRAPKRAMVLDHMLEPLMGQVVGVTFKKEGTYYPASGGGPGYFSEESDYEPASLGNLTVHKLWEVKVALKGRVLLVPPAHIEFLGCAGSGGFTLPYQKSLHRRDGKRLRNEFLVAVGVPA